MLPTIALAFVAGVITILSPCVLPLLPMILATATQQGKARPAGVIVGFVLAFTAATVALSALVRLLGVPPDINRTLSAVILALLGLVLIIPGLQLRFERLAGGLAGRAPSSASNGFGGGVTIRYGHLWLLIFRLAGCLVPLNCERLDRRRVLRRRNECVRHWASPHNRKYPS